MSKLISRRGLLTGLVGLVAAPAVVKVESLMKIAVPKAIIPDGTMWYRHQQLLVWSADMSMWKQVPLADIMFRVTAASFKTRYGLVSTR